MWLTAVAGEYATPNNFAAGAAWTGKSRNLINTKHDCSWLLKTNLGLLVHDDRREVERLERVAESIKAWIAKVAVGRYEERRKQKAHFAKLSTRWVVEIRIWLHNAHRDKLELNDKPEPRDKRLVRHDKLPGRRDKLVRHDRQRVRGKQQGRDKQLVRDRRPGLRRQKALNIKLCNSHYHAINNSP